MKTLKSLFGTSIFIMFFLSITFGCSEETKQKKLEYRVNRLTDSLAIDADWNKQQWQKVNFVEIKNIMSEIPKHVPKTKVKVLYDDDNIYIIFHVEEKYVKAVATHINDRIYRDSAVEFFFTPSETIKDGYFNLEINCGGMPYFSHQTGFKKNTLEIDVDDIKKIKIAHSLPTIVNPEIEELTEWNIECRIPIDMLVKYAKVNKPAPGVVWKGNFYKTADATSNPHYITWNVVDNATPNFHLPKYFGNIKFN